jgi:hypothetical protein
MEERVSVERERSCRPNLLGRRRTPTLATCLLVLALLVVVAPGELRTTRGSPVSEGMRAA